MSSSETSSSIDRSNVISRSMASEDRERNYKKRPSSRDISMGDRVKSITDIVVIAEVQVVEGVRTKRDENGDRTVRSSDNKYIIKFDKP